MNLVLGGFFGISFCVFLNLASSGQALEASIWALIAAVFICTFAIIEAIQKLNGTSEKPRATQGSTSPEA